MKLTIKNFKSIRLLNEFDIKPFTVVSGVNSSGKSSFIQLLLLLKQTVESNSIGKPLDLEGDWYKASDYKDLVYKKDLDNQLEVSFLFDKSNFTLIEKTKNTYLDLYDTHEDYNCKVTIKYDLEGEAVSINEFSLIFSTPNSVPPHDYIKFKKDATKAFYTAEANKTYFAQGLSNVEKKVTDVEYVSIFPLFYTIKDEKRFVIIDDVKQLIQTFFAQLSYLGPIRMTPKDEYTISSKQKTVGRNGEYTAQVLEEYANESIFYNKIEKHENGINYIPSESTLKDAVKYWMCDVFDVAKDIYAEKISDSYKVILTDKSDLNTSIKHVGFGISQLLPIVVEGLRMSENGTFIVEQPEVHLHPKVQSWLFDFLYSLTLQGKTVIVETHSGHFITRMRRRIAEDMANEMDDKINLTFIENNVFRTIDLDDYGVLDYFPKDFIEPSSEERRAAIKAQMNKRIKNQL